MRALDPAWLKLNGQGCHMARDPLPVLAQSGFEIVASERFQVFAPALPAFPMRRIRARRASLGADETSMRRSP
jgi:hypothetical protein